MSFRSQNTITMSAFEGRETKKKKKKLIAGFGFIKSANGQACVLKVRPQIPKAPSAFVIFSTY